MEHLIGLKEKYRGLPVTGTTFDNLILDIGQLTQQETSGWTYRLSQETDHANKDCNNGGIREGILRQIISDAEGEFVADIHMIVKVKDSRCNSMVVDTLVTIHMRK